MTIQYPLEERIGPPDLLVGRVDEFASFHAWIENIPRKLSPSRVILARRKSGKTSFVQRLFNELWSQNGKVIPFYFDMADTPIWYPDFAIKYYRLFASQFISFRERNPVLVQTPLTIEEILAYAEENKLEVMIRDATFMLQHRAGGSYDLMWDAACCAPHRYAAVYDLRFVVILDEFQYVADFVYRDEACASQPIHDLPGSFHSLAESKVAPMLVTGSYIGILMKIIHKHFEGGRLAITRFEPYLTPEEGLLAVYKYAEIYRKAITNQTAQQINELCMADPFFISQVILSDYKGKDLTISDGVINAVNYEITNRRSMMSGTWAEYLHLTFRRVNGIHTKSMMLFLNKYADRYWTVREIKEKLNLEMSEKEVYDRLVLLAESDVIERGVSDIQFRGLQDGTLKLILRSRFEQEIEGFEPDLRDEFKSRLLALKKDNQRLQGQVNYLAGMLAEHLLAIDFRTRKHFRLSDYFTGGSDDRPFNVVEVYERVPFPRPDSKGEEIDVLVKTDDGRVLMVEVRKQQEKTNLKAVQDLRDNALAYAQQFGVTVLPAFLSLGGFTEQASSFCGANGIATAEQIAYYQPSLEL
ncbi:MAG: hypothetical protein R3E79_40225 [Caldilineaceae bacterium]